LRSRVTTPAQAIAFVERHGIVLEAARGPVPSLAEAVVGAPIRGSWWAHAQGTTIHNITAAVRDDPSILVCRIVGGRVTYVHRKLWPALVRLAVLFDHADLGAVREEHTASGKHRVVTTPFPVWVPPDVHVAARRLTDADARAALAPLVAP